MARVGFLYGGISVEHEISILTALQAMSACDVTCHTVVPIYVCQEGRWWMGDALFNKDIYRKRNFAKLKEITIPPKPGSIDIDVFVPCFHGQYGEDGCVQGLLELTGIPYTGCGVLASALCMDKLACKRILRSEGIPVLPERIARRRNARRDIHSLVDQIEEMPYPLFVKPSRLGSSIGVAPAKDRTELLAALAQGFRFDEVLLIEPCMQNLMEINVAVLEGDPPIASVVEVPASTQGVLTYADKYLRGGKGKGTGSGQGMASLVRSINPPSLDVAIKERVRDYALRAFDLLGCQGTIRFDFMMNTVTGDLYLNEANTLPGSLAFYLWSESEPRLLLTEVLERMIAGAIARRTDRACVESNVGFAALT